MTSRRQTYKYTDICKKLLCLMDICLFVFIEQHKLDA